MPTNLAPLGEQMIMINLPNFRTLLCILAFVVSFLASPAIDAQELCPPTKVAIKEEAPELKIMEWEFTTTRALASLDWLEDEFITTIRDHKPTDEPLDFLVLSIRYPNSIIFIRGALLRQEALAAQARFETASLLRKTGKITAGQLKYAQEDYELTRKKFCTFVLAAYKAD